MTRNGVVTAAEILANVPRSLVEYPLWKPGQDPAMAPKRAPAVNRAPCGTTTARKRHRRHRENCAACDAASHGTHATYANRRCRCEPCVEAERVYHQARRARLVSTP